MQNKSFISNFKLSGLSVAIIVIVFMAFIFAKLFIPTPKEHEERYAQIVNEQLQKEDARVLGITVEELQQREANGKRLFKLFRGLNTAIYNKDKALLLSVLSKLSLSDFKSKEYLLLSNAIQADNLTALELLIDKGISCDSKDNSGKNAFHQAINTKESVYIKYLKENCNYSENKSIAQRIMNSHYPEKLFDLNSTYETQKYKDELFILIIRQEGHKKAALRLLDKGASPNAKKDGRSALLYSVLARHTEVSKELIKLGADITAKDLGGMSILSASLIKNQLKIARYILETLPDYFEDVEKESTVLSLVFHLAKDSPKYDYEALNLLIEFGLDKNRFIKGKGHLWLRKAVRLKNIKLVKQLLAMGVDKNNQDNLNNLLRNMKVRNIYSNESIAGLLKQYGAIEVVKKPKKKRAFTKKTKYSKRDLLLINKDWLNTKRYYVNAVTGNIEDTSWKLDGINPLKATIVYDFKKENQLMIKILESEQQVQWSLSKSNSQLYLDNSIYEIITLNDALLKIRYKTKLYGIELYDTYEFEPLKR